MDALNTSLSNQGPLARAIIHAEILGKPMALRPEASHEFNY
jgi:hypothetical protein